MATELRWILLALSVPLLAGIWWWGTRRSRQAPGNAELRESSAGAAPGFGRPAAPEEPAPSGPGGTREWGVSPLEPLNIRTAEFDDVQIVDLPMTANPDSLDEALNATGAEHQPDGAVFASASSATLEATHDLDEMDAYPAESAHAPADDPWPEPPPPAVPDVHPQAEAPPAVDTGATATHPQAPNAAETQRIISVRVCAAGEARWSGSALKAALEDCGMAYGRYQIFHRRHGDGRTLFCAASLVEPGTFDLARMQEEEFRGISLFAVLPGPVEPLRTLNAVIETAGRLAGALHGTLQDAKGAPLSRQRAEALRDEVAQFQAMLTMS